MNKINKRTNKNVETRIRYYTGYSCIGVENKGDNTRDE